jgi:hypothetical protein
MRVVYWIILVGIIIASLWAQHDFDSRPGEPFYLLLAGASGRVVGSLILPIIAWAIVSLIRRENRPSLSAFCAIGGAIATCLALVGSYSRHKSEQKDVELSHVYSMEGCKFTVNFPGISRERALTAPGIGEYKQVDFSTKNAYLRAECIPVNHTQSREQLRENLEKYAEADGFTGTTIQPVTDFSEALWEMRAYKKVESVPVTFKFRVFYAEGSLMTLAVGIASKDYPLPIEDKFFGSVRRK